MRVQFYGDGKQATTIFFNPSVSSTPLFAIATSSGSFMTQISFKRFGVIGQGSVAKIGILAQDTSLLTIEDVAMTLLNSTDGNSIGIKLQGRELTTINRVDVNADKPMVISDNPNSIIDVDHLYVRDSYFIASSTNPIITIDSGVNLTNVVFDGGSWVKGGYGVYWVDSSAVAASQNLVIRNIRWEQSTNPNGYIVDIEHNSMLQNFSMDNVYGGVYTNGVKLRNVKWVSLENVIYVGSSTAFNANTSTWPINFKNVFFQLGSTSTFGSLVKVVDSGRSNQVGTVYSFAIWDNPISTTAFNINQLSIGTNTPYASLAVLGTLGTNPVRIMSSTGDTLLHILQNGNVSVGTSTDVGPLYVGGETGITWSANSVAPSRGLVTIGTGGTAGGSLWINTGSLAVGNGINSGLGIDGTYTSNKSTVQLTSYGVRSAGYSGDLSLKTTNTGNITEVLRLTTSLGGNKPRVGLNSSTPISTFSIQSSAGDNPLSINSSSGASYFSILENGNVGINTTSPQYRFSASGTVGFVNLTTNITGNGLCHTATGEVADAGAAACIPSALKYKTKTSLYTKSAVSLFTDLFNAGAVQNYELKSKLGDPRKGLIADVVEKIDPDLVGYSVDGSVNTLHFEDFTGLAVKAVAELENKNKELEVRISALENKIVIKYSFWDWIISLFKR